MDSSLHNCIKKSLKLLQNKKGQKNLGYPTKKQSFYKQKKTAFLSGTPNLFGPSYFEAALRVCPIFADSVKYDNFLGVLSTLEVTNFDP